MNMSLLIAELWQEGAKIVTGYTYRPL